MRLGRKKNQNGLTLVEVMIALVLSSLVLAGLFSLFLTTRRNQEISQHLNRQGEDARFISEFIASDLRMAGYQPESGCSFEEQGLEWDADRRELTVRYCQVSNDGPGKKTRVYEFDEENNRKEKITVRYDPNCETKDNSQSKGCNFQPLIDGVALNEIWFGKKNTDGTKPNDGFKYFAQDSSDFSDIRSVRLKLEIRGDGSENDSDKIKAQRMFYLTTAIRNNLLDQSTNSETKQSNTDPDLDE